MGGMKSRILRIALVVALFNIALILLSVGLSVQATKSHPMSGELVATDYGQIHVIDSLRLDSASLDSARRDVDKTDTDQNPLTPIVLIHGANTSALDFSTNLMPLLSASRRVIAIDRPGHGYSDRGEDENISDPQRQATVMLDALHAMGVSDAIVVGHSWAGSVVMASLLSEHDHVRVKAGVLIAGATHPWEGDPVWHVRLSQIPLIGDVFRWQYIAPFGRLSLDSAVATVFAPESVPPGYIDNTGLTLSLRPSVYLNNAKDRVTLSDRLAVLSKRYADIQTPLLSIAASADTVVPAWNHHDRLVKQIPDLETLVLEGSGHAPHHTQSEQVAHSIETFVQNLQL